jgi:hypothetical protein
LYNMVIKYPRREGMLMSVAMWASYLGDQKGNECLPSSCAAVLTAFLTLWVHC